MDTIQFNSENVPPVAAIFDKKGSKHFDKLEFELKHHIKMYTALPNKYLRTKCKTKEIPGVFSSLSVKPFNSSTAVWRHYSNCNPGSLQIKNKKYKRENTLLGSVCFMLKTEIGVALCFYHH